VIMATLMIFVPPGLSMKYLKLSLLNRFDTDASYEKAMQKEITKMALYSPQFILLFIMSFFSLCYGYFLINAYKLFGQRNNLDDQFLTTVGAVGSIFNCGARLFGAWLIDKYNFK